MLPKKIIGNLSVRDYAYQWINGGCLMHQWCSGGRGIDNEVTDFAEMQLRKIKASIATADGRKSTGWTKRDASEFAELVAYLKENKGAAAETYVPDQWK